MPGKTKTTNPPRSPFLWLSIGILIVSCMIVIVLFMLAADINRRAELVFGPASDRLSPFQKLQYSQKLLSHRSQLELPHADPGKIATFRVKPGESIISVTNRLEEDGWIIDAHTMIDYLVFAGLDTSLQSGEFELDGKMNAIQIAQELQDSSPDVVAFRILAGWRLEEIAASLPTSGLEFTPQDLFDAVNNPPESLQVLLDIPMESGLEGFLFPDRYRFNRNVTTAEFLEVVLTNFNLKVDHQMRANYDHLGYSLIEAVTLASIIQREAVIEEEMPMIASVFFNRLKVGMKLETDPTVQYALGQDPLTENWWKNPLTLEDLKFTSPYNTYLNPGLPPAPISNPGLAALSAVAYPAQTPYFFFRSACDGSGRHNFSETFEEHTQNACPPGEN